MAKNMDSKNKSTNCKNAYGKDSTNAADKNGQNKTSDEVSGKVSDKATDAYDRNGQ